MRCQRHPGPRTYSARGDGGFGALIEALAKEARGFRDRGAKVIDVIANRVATARKIHADLAGDADSDAILLTGRERAYDLGRLWTKWQPSIKLGRKSAPEKPIFVVATQCIEVGANIDFDALATEVASLDALEQRFGRLNREGRPVISDAVIVAQKDQTKKKYIDAVYGEAMPASWSWLEAHRSRIDETVTLPAEGKKKTKTKKIRHEFVAMGVLELRRAMAETQDRELFTMPRRHVPVLMPAHVDLLCQTSPAPAHVPEPSVFLHGPQAGPADVNVVWRGDLPNDRPEDRELWAGIVAICPPSAAENIALPIWAVRRWLSRSSESDLSDIEGIDQEERPSKRDSRPVLCWMGADESRLLDSADQVRPGMTVVVPAEYGGCDEWGWNPAYQQTVADIGDTVKLAMGRPILRLNASLARDAGYEDLARQLRGIDGVADARQTLSHYSIGAGDTWIGKAAKTLASSSSFKLINSPDPESEELFAVSGREAFDQGEGRSSYTVEVLLKEHLSGCEALANAFATGLPDPLRDTVSRAAALHDVGKADRRFQAWLRGGNPVKPKELLAKSKRAGRNSASIERARQMAGYPKGCRHELMSVALLAGRFGDDKTIDGDLLLHLVGGHHGRCRPFAPVVADLTPVDVSFNGWGANSDHGLERAGSGISERFWRLTRRYGWYGLAYLEALVRLADHRQSEAEEDRAEEPSGRDDEIELRGIDGANLLGFLAALGVLRLLTRAGTRYGGRPLMYWKWRSKWSPVLRTADTADGIVAELAAALCPDTADPAVKGKKSAPDANVVLAKANRAFRSDVLDLNLAEFRNTLWNAALNGDRNEADFLSALGSDCYPERKEEVTPATTEFRAIGGGNNDGFLGLMRAIHTETKPEHLRSALFDDWTYSDPPPFMRWDPNEFRPHALRGKDPAKDRKQNNVRGANRLAIEALPLFVTSLLGARFERRASRTAIR